MYTVSKLLIDAGLACAAFHDKTVRGVAAKAVQCDEIWSFSYAKNKNVKFAKAGRSDTFAHSPCWDRGKKLLTFCGADR